MDERYEIQGKVGQGGIGSVHRAYDHKLKREVAIKRILTSEEDPDLEGEATKQMIAEARALASLQHPHIVTILDVGTDSKGPYVVMELLTGNTLDELIEKSPLTWDDFKEVATQSLEALIAAQELGMIHSDLKPPNIMLTWLPSGKFQVKVLDFGLAVLIQSQSQEEIENVESVFGSIFFMPPEQFERQTLDERSDLYSLGCCFYQSLAGDYPFTGNDGEEVMQAHLEHTVIPIQEARQDIPEWASQWVMWLINRERDDRPATARDALANFLENERLEEEAKNKPRGPKRLIASSDTSPVSTVTSAQATAQTSAVELPKEEGGEENEEQAAPQKKLSPKVIKMAAIAAGLLLFCGLAWLLKQRSDRAQSTKAYTSLITKASADGVTQILINERKLKMVLQGLSDQGAAADLDAASQALLKVQAQDDGNTELIITEFATTADMPDATRKMLFKEVISMRDPEGCTPLLLGYAKEAKPELAAAALAAAGGLVEDEHAPALLSIIASGDNQAVLEEASALMREIMSWSDNRTKFTKQIEASLKQAKSKAAKTELKGLLGRAKPGGKTPKPSPTPSKDPQAKEFKHLLGQLKSTHESSQLSALATLPKMRNLDAHGPLLSYIENASKSELRIKGIEASIALLREAATSENHTGYFKQLMWKTDKESYAERKPLIEALGEIGTDWAAEILQEISRSPNAEIKQLSKETLKSMGK